MKVEPVNLPLRCRHFGLAEAQTVKNGGLLVSVQEISRDVFTQW